MKREMRRAEMQQKTGQEKQQDTRWEGKGKNKTTGSRHIFSSGLDGNPEEQTAV